MIFLLGLVLLASVVFLLRFVTALEVESRRRPTGKASVHMKMQSLATVSEIRSRQPEQARLTSNAARSFGERDMRIVVVVLAMALCALPLRAQEVASPSNAASAEDLRELRQLVQELKAKVERLEKNQTPQPVPKNAPNNEIGTEVVVPHDALVAESRASSQATTPEKPKKAEPFAFADWTWLNGNPRTKTPAFDSPFFTPEIRADVDYIYDFRHPKDDTISGSSEVFRANEIQLTQLGVGGDFHYDNVRARLMTQFGMYSQTTPRNDASPSRGQWNL